MSPDYRPVVVELKRGGSTRHRVAHAARDGRVRHRAPDGLAEPARAALGGGDAASWQHATPAPTALGRVTLIGAAPPQYWARAMGSDPADPTGRVPEDAWPRFCELVAEVSRRCDFSIHFARVDEAPRGVGDADAPNDGDPPSPFEGHPQPVRADVIPLCPCA